MVTGLYNPDLLQNVPALSGTSLQVQRENLPATTITFGTGSGEAQTFSDLQAALAGTGVNPDILQFPSVPPTMTPLLYFADVPGLTQKSMMLSGSALARLNMGAGTFGGGMFGTVDPTRAAIAQQYNAVLRQISTLAQDSSYAGVDMLAGNNLRVILNESGSSSLSINAADDTLGGLALTPVPSDGFQTDGDVDAYIGRIDAVLGNLRTQAAQFGSSLQKVQVREKFTKAMISTLQGGADDLTLADSNAEGANLLALQTRQQLSTTALNLSTQSSQSVSRLFA